MFIDSDPTAHGEVTAIRNAGKVLKSHKLKDCIIYSSTEPCAMCTSAIYLSEAKHVYYANSIEDL